MFDGPLMLQVNSTIVDTIHSISNKFVTGVKIKATVDLKLNDSPDRQLGLLHYEKVLLPNTVKTRV